MTIGNEYLQNNLKMYLLHQNSIKYDEEHKGEYISLELVDYFVISYIDIYGEERTNYYRENHHTTKEEYEKLVKKVNPHIRITGQYITARKPITYRCQKCGFDGEILIDDKLEWYCPNCGNRDHDTLNVARRTCGYIGSNFWNKGRTQEIKERVLHVDNKDCDE